MNNFKFDKRLIIMIAGGAGFIVLCLVLIMPLLGEIAKYGREVKALESEMASARQVIQMKDKFRKPGKLLTRQTISLAIDEITKVGATKNINFVSISPQKIGTPKGSKYPVLPIQMSLRSDYEDLGLFLGGLEELKESITAVKKFNIRADAQVLPKISTDLLLEVYLREGEDG